LSWSEIDRFNYVFASQGFDQTTFFLGKKSGCFEPHLTTPAIKKPMASYYHAYCSAPVARITIKWNS
jgi:hypothetical protein